jgi:hypothetical protein
LRPGQRGQSETERRGLQRFELDLALYAQALGRALKAHAGDAIAESIELLAPTAGLGLHGEPMGQQTNPARARREPQHVLPERDRNIVAIQALVANLKQHASDA